MPGISNEDFPDRRKSLGRIAHWTIPLGIYRMLTEWGHRGRRRSEIADTLSGNAAFKNRHAGERCFILATGPSLKNQDLTPLAREHCFGVSFFALHAQASIVRPAYHVVAPYHHPFTFADLDKLWGSFRSSYQPGCEYFLGHKPYKFSTRRYVVANKLDNEFKLHYLDYTSGYLLSEENHAMEELWDITRSPFTPRTVLYSAIQVAAYMGFSKIYLLGADHDYLSDLSRVTDHHCYAEDKGQSDAAHLSAFDTEYWFREYANRWRDYRLMKQYLATRGIQVLNSTAGGMLDVFERIRYESLFPGHFGAANAGA